MMKGLMGRCLNHETTLDRVKVRVNETEDELNGLKAWKVGMEKNLDMSEKVKKKLEEHMETMKKVLEDKEKEIKDARDQLRQVKEVAIREYRNSNTLLKELRTASMTSSVRPRKLNLTLTFLNLILMCKPRLLLNPSPLRVHRIYLLMMQPLATRSQLLLKTKPSSSMVMPVSLKSVQENVENTPTH